MKNKLESLWKLLSQLGGDNTEDFLAKLETIRAKFKQVKNRLSVKEYQPKIYKLLTEHEVWIH